MKVPPLNLNPEMNRPGLALPFSPDLLWRYPLSFPQATAPPPSPLLDVKNQMPAHLAADPRCWSREDVSIFLRWFEREYELPSIDTTKFCMNGKALCMLTKCDLNDRAPSAGDILHNTLQFLLRDAPQVPPSPITPHHPLLSPTSLQPNQGQPWSLVGADFHSLGQFLQQNGSVTLSPAPSEQSGGSPRHGHNYMQTSSGASTGGSSHNSTHSDSEDSNRDSNSPQRSPKLPAHSVASTFSVQALASLKHLSDYKRAAAAAAAVAAAQHQHQQAQHNQQEDMKPQMPVSQSHHTQHSVVSSQTTVRNPTPPQHQVQQPQPPHPQHSPDEPLETATNGRLLWDFLQQLLNDAQQRYNRYIAWKNRDTGVFKIVDPPGLARLWGIQKNHLSMNYDKMSRALRYYYRVNILRKVQGERHCYQFLRNPSELKSIKNISLLRGVPPPAQPPSQQPQMPQMPQMPTLPQQTQQLIHNLAAIAQPDLNVEDMDEEGPTDLSMGGVNHSQNHQYPSVQHRREDHHSAQSQDLNDFRQLDSRTGEVMSIKTELREQFSSEPIYD